MRFISYFISRLFINKKRFPNPFFYLIIGLFSLVACQSSETGSSANNEDNETFCKLFEQAVNDGNSEFVDLVFDRDHLINKVIDGIDAPEDFVEGFKEGFDAYYTPGSVLTASLGQTGYYKFLQMKEGNSAIALFRVVSEIGVNYHELALGLDENGEIVLKDFYSYLDAEWFTESIRRLYIINLAEEDENFSHPLADALPEINDIANMADLGQKEEAFEKLKSLPPAVLNQKIVLVIALTLGNDLGPEKLQEATALFNQYHKGDPLLELKMMEYSFRAGDKDKILEAIRQLEPKTGNDPYLKVIQGALLKEQGDIAEAKQFLKAAIAAEPDNDEAYWIMIDLLIKEKEYDTTIVWFEKMLAQFEENAADYVIYDKYKEFFETDQYKNWIKEHPLSERVDLNPDALDDHGHDGHNHDGHDHHGHNH